MASISSPVRGSAPSRAISRPSTRRQRRGAVGEQDVGAVAVVQFGQPGIQAGFYGHDPHDRIDAGLTVRNAEQPGHNGRPTTRRRRCRSSGVSFLSHTMLSKVPLTGGVR